MQKFRSVCGLIAALLVFLSAFASTFPAALIGAAYLLYAGWAGIHSNGDPFIFLSIVPGLLIALAVS
jgi:hypothetical protein